MIEYDSRTNFKSDACSKSNLPFVACKRCDTYMYIVDLQGGNLYGDCVKMSP